MKTVLTAAEMKTCDSYTIEKIGVPSAVLMERAALAAADEVLSLRGDSDGAVLILCGSGNNGGDGFACARILHMKGVPVTVLFAGREENMTAETRRQSGICGRLGLRAVKPEEIPEDGNAGERFWNSFEVIVDALLGIGLTREVVGSMRDLIQKANAARARIVSIDIPSGVDADTGRVLGTGIYAAVTVTMQCIKPGLLLYPGAENTGRLVAADLGIVEPASGNPGVLEAVSGISSGAAESASGISGTEESASGISGAAESVSGITGSHHNRVTSDICPMRLMEREDLKLVLPVRSASGNKGTFGKLLIIAGSENMAGAAFLCASAALRSGAGMVKVLTPAVNREILQRSLPEAMLATWDSLGKMETELRQALDWCDAVVCGPGIGRSEEASRLVHELMAVCEKPVVLDADGLNVLEGDLSVLTDTPSGRVTLTPHIGEMARLTGKSAADIKNDLVASAREISRLTGATCVLKDARTVTALPDGGIFFNNTGNSGMATAGSGDVLAGILGSLIVQGTDPGYAAAAAVVLHGAAGDEAAAEQGRRFMTAGDIVSGIRTVLREEP